MPRPETQRACPKCQTPIIVSMEFNDTVHCMKCGGVSKLRADGQLFLLGVMPPTPR